MNKELLKNKNLLIKPLLKRNFEKSFNNIKSFGLEPLQEDCEEDKENQCQTTNTFNSSQQNSDLFESSLIVDRFVNKKKRMRTEQNVTNSILATPLEESPKTPAIDKLIRKSGITFTRIPREKSVNVVVNKPIDSIRKKNVQNIFDASEDLEVSLDETDHLETKYSLFENENEDQEVKESKSKKYKTRRSSAKKSTTSDKAASKNNNDNSLSEDELGEPKRTARTRAATKNQAKYVFSEDENVDKNSPTSSDKEDVYTKGDNKKTKSKKTYQTRKSTAKKPVKIPKSQVNVDKLDLSVKSDDQDVYAINDNHEDMKPKSIFKINNTVNSSKVATKKKATSKAQLKKQRLDEQTQIELEAYYKEQQEIKNYKLVVEICDHD